MKKQINSRSGNRSSATVPLVLATMLGFSTVNAHAVSSDWVETEGGRIRITALPPSSEGIIRAILDVDLLPGWKTYWRDPGDAGVPPSIKFEGSTNIEQSYLSFPAPERIDDGYSVWAGYTYPVAFPLTLHQQKAGSSSVVEAQVFLGICKTICIPLQNDFSLKIGPEHQANGFETRIVEKAFAQIPEQSGDDFSVVETSFSQQHNALLVSVEHPSSDSDVEIFLTGPTGWYFDIPKRVSGEDGLSNFQIAIIDSPDNGKLSGQPVQILVKTSARSMETTLNLPK